jgi:hypothetical protein
LDDALTLGTITLDSVCAKQTTALHLASQNNAGIRKGETITPVALFTT